MKEPLMYIVFCLLSALCLILWGLDILDWISAFVGAALSFLFGMVYLIDWKR